MMTLLTKQRLGEEKKPLIKNGEPTVVWLVTTSSSAFNLLTAQQNYPVLYLPTLSD